MGSRKTLAFALLTCPPLLVLLCSRLVFGTSWPVAIVMGFLSSFAFCDAWYFLRMAYLVAFVERSSSSDAPPRRKHLFDVSEVSGRVSLADIDRNGHCNNARYLRECGFGRRDFWQHNGVWSILTAVGGNLVVGAQTVRYRRELSFGQRYTMETRVICWDKRAFYVEHRFVTQVTPDADKFINAILLVKNNVLGPMSPEKLVAALPDVKDDEKTSPPIPEDIAAWIQSNDASSKALRAQKP